MSETFPDNKPNIQTAADFDSYRELLDPITGMMRIGVYDKTIYDAVLSDTNTAFFELGENHGVHIPISSCNRVVGEYNDDCMDPNTSISLLTREQLEFLGVDTKADIIPGQKILYPGLTQQLLKRPRCLRHNEITSFLTEGDVNLYSESGLPEFVVLTKYDISACKEIKKSAPPVTVELGDNIFTSSRRLIAERIDALAEIHMKKFDDQASAIGYYGGLDKAELLKTIRDPQFIPIAVFGKENAEARGLALFSPYFKNFEFINWLNKQGITSELEKMGGTPESFVSVPYIINSEGLGLFPKIVELATKWSIFLTKADTIFTLYESSGESIHYSPSIINRGVENLGGINLGTVIEASYLTKMN